MDCEIKKIVAKHGREKMMIYFSDDKYSLLTAFIGCDVASFGTSWIKKFIREFDEVLSDEVEYKKGHLNLFAFEIGPVTTKVVNMFALDEGDEECHECEVETKELRQIIEDWYDAFYEFRQTQEIEAMDTKVSERSSHVSMERGET